MSRKFYEVHQNTTGSQPPRDALALLTGMALFDALEHPAFVRLAGYKDAIYLDLTNTAWEAVEVTASGWRVLTDLPVKFRRPRTVLAPGAVRHPKKGWPPRFEVRAKNDSLQSRNPRIPRTEWGRGATNRKTERSGSRQARFGPEKRRLIGAFPTEVQVFSAEMAVRRHR